jgi:hypothetical protein
MAAGYCYFDRLHFLTQGRDLQPLAFGFCLLQQNLLAVLSLAEAGFRDEASFRPQCHFPKDLDQFQKTGAEALYF